MTRQQLEQFVKELIFVFKRGKREQAAFAITLLCFSGGLWLGENRVPDFSNGLDWKEIVQLGLYAAGAIALGYAIVRVWRLVHPPELPPAKDRPSAIKGPMAFTEADGELFRKLGRESELQKLLGLALDDQVLLVVIRGASGAGKTSLLRAGLKHILGDRAIFHYWEAVPTEPDKGLLRAIQEKWPEGATKPATLEELVNPAETLGRQSHVFVLDQFEQMRGNKKMFALLRRIIRESKRPHRITWVIAFRREFSADWMDFASPELERGLERGIRPPQDVSLRLFTADQAREVIGQLVNESNLKDSIEQSVINNLVEAATVEGEVSPVDIGIGLLVLAELHERQSGNTITIRDYQFAGGAEGLLTQYISRCLELFPKENQEAILKAMLALRDAETNQRLAEGLTVDELAAESGAEARLLKTQLDRLSHRDTRLLETVTPADGSPTRYRLPHERLVPALYRLTGKLLAEVDQAKLKFQNAFQAWKTNDKRSHYLLKAKELRLVERFETQIPWGNDEQEKKRFLSRSKLRRKIVRAINGVAVIGILGLVWFFWEPLTEYPRMEAERYLDERDYYVSLTDLQHQLTNLKKLELTRLPDFKRFSCSPSQSLEELTLRARPSPDPFAGLTYISKCKSLKSLTLTLIGDQMSDLEPLSNLNSLERLTLGFSSGEAINVEKLSKLTSLTQLTLSLNGGQTKYLMPLFKLSAKTQLKLNLGGSEGNDWELLSKLNNLTQLTLDLRFCQASNLEQLAKLSNLTELTLDLSNCKVKDLEPLSKLSKLTQLTLKLDGSRVSSLDALSKLSNLTHLTLELYESRVNNLEPLSKLSSLTQLTLDLRGSEVNNLEPLLKLSEKARLKLKLSKGQVSEWKLLSKLSNLTQLTLELGYSPASDLGLLSKLNLNEGTKLELHLDSYEAMDMEPLSKLNSLILLKLDLKFARMSDLEMLSTLSNLRQLTQLTLDLRYSAVSDLELLSRLSNLTQLTLRFRDDSFFYVVGNSQVGSLEPISKLIRLRSLSLEGATRAQRMSLRNLPPNLVELKF